MQARTANFLRVVGKFKHIAVARPTLTDDNIGGGPKARSCHLRAERRCPAPSRDSTPCCLAVQRIFSDAITAASRVRWYGDKYATEGLRAIMPYRSWSGARSLKKNRYRGAHFATIGTCATTDFESRQPPLVSGPVNIEYRADAQHPRTFQI